MGRLVSVFSFSCFLSASLVASADTDQLINVKDASGNRTPLFEKVVVVSDSATISRRPTGSGEPVEAWAIFFRIKNEDGSTSASNGRLRIGNSRGVPVGWIDSKHVRSWNTRFILDPIEPQQDRAFEVALDGATAKQNATPEGKRRYALIVDTPPEEEGDDTEYPVVVYAGNVQGIDQGGTLARQRNELTSVKLELCFVVESTDFMLAVFDEDKGNTTSLLDHVKSSIRQLLSDLRADNEISDAVRFGFTEYKDSVPKADFVSRLTCDLTDNIDVFSKSLDDVKATALEDDWPDDVLSGLNEAVSSASWSQNSVKHVILLGVGSCQLAAKGANPPDNGQPGSNWNRVLSTVGKSPRGHNASGLSISQLISRGRPQGGGESRARSARTFHSLQFGRDIFASIPVEKRAETRANIAEIRRTVDSLSFEKYVALLGDEQAGQAIFLVEALRTYTHQRKLASAQYKQLAQNNGEADGVYISVEPSDRAVQTSVKTLAGKIRETFNVLKDVRSGEGLPETTSNEFAQPLFTLVGAAAEKFKNSPVYEGTATVRNARGREVAFKKVMVSEDELRRLRSTLDALHTKFINMTGKAERQNVGTILDTMKEIIAETSAGQGVAAETKLKDLISTLPLRTAALDTTAQDLALMTSDAFLEWLERVSATRARIDDLLSSRQDWLSLSELAVNDRFTFLRLSELP